MSNYLHYRAAHQNADGEWGYFAWKFTEGDFENKGGYSPLKTFQLDNQYRATYDPPITWDNTLRVVDEINQYNPIANLMDVVFNAFTGADRFGNKMSNADAWIKAAGVFPVSRVGGTAVKTLQLTSKVRTAEKGLEIGERFLGKVFDAAEKYYKISSFNE
jgi:hypothetical protein